MLENTILPKDPGFVRVATPPRVITLENNFFPNASDENRHEEEEDYSGSHNGPRSLDFIGEKKSSQKHRKGIPQINHDLSFQR